MKVLHIESGLGNQMLDYCDLLATRYSNPEQDIYIETIIYSIPEASKVFSMWNGYELENVFGIKEKNVKSLFSSEEWQQIISEVTESKFWEDNWRYSDAIADAFINQGLDIKNVYSRPHKSEVKHHWKTDFAKTLVGYHIKRFSYRALEPYMNRPANLFVKNDEDEYKGHTLRFMKKNSGIELIDAQIRNVFRFPAISDEYNKKISNAIQTSNSVAIHVRRGDLLGLNAPYYKFGYFKRAVKFIKKRVSSPIFFFFCNNDSMEWVKRNLDSFALDERRDSFHFVIGNTAQNSFRDMQLMSQCKHAVITNTSFGFWGAYLINNSNKITCSPDIRINTTHCF